MSGRPSGNYFFIHSDVLEPLCKFYFEHPGKSFTFKELHQVSPTYDHSMHKRLTYRNYIIHKTDRKEVASSGNIITSRCYAIGKELYEWYDKNYISMTGHSKIALKNRESIGITLSDAMKLHRDRHKKRHRHMIDPIQ